MSAVLSVENLTKEFPGIKALDRLSFSLSKGEVHALCGENGAGKSTLIKCISGIWPHGSYEGSIQLSGRLAKFRNIRDAENAGIAVIYQELALVESMTVAENIFLGREPRNGPLVNWQAMYSNCQKILAKYDLELNPNQIVNELGVGQQQLVEIVKALSKNAHILLLDEPTSALTDKEVDTLLQIIEKLKSNGIACLYISHKLEEVLRVADNITVIRDGQSIDSKPGSAWNYDAIVNEMVGRKIEDFFPRRQTKIGERLLETQNVSTPKLNDICLHVNAGEVLGIGGLMGAGRSELLMHLFHGAGERLSGQVLLRGQHYNHASARSSIELGIAMVTEDRKNSGLVLDESVAFNMSLAHLRSLVNGLLIDGRQEMRKNLTYADRLKIKAPDLSFPVSGLSGGNQQKVVLGKWLMTTPDIVFLDEPTRGIDVGAKVEVYQLINQITERGKAVILVSSDMPELIGMSDRIIILSSGRLAGEFKRGETSQQELLQAAMKYN